MERLFGKMDKLMKCYWSYFGNLACIILLIAGILFCPPKADAQQNVRIGYVDMPNFFTAVSRNSYSGYAYCYMEMLSGYADWNYTYVPGTWDECVRRLSNNEIDIMIGAPGDILTIPNASITRISIGHFFHYIALRNNSIENENNHPHFRLGTLAGVLKNDSFSRMASMYGINYSLNTYDSFSDMNNAYNDKQLDGFISMWTFPSRDTNYRIFDIEPVYLVTSKSNTELFNHLSFAMNAMDICDPDLRTRLSKEFYTTNFERIPLTEAEKEYLKEKKVLKVLATDNQRPYSYFENGVHKGVIAEVLKRIIDDLDIQLEVRPLGEGTDPYTVLSDGDADFIADIYCDVPTALKNHLRLTTPYLSIDYVPVTRISDSLPSQPKVACINGHTYTSKFVETRYAYPDRYYCNSIEESLEAVNSKKADVVYLNNITAMYNIWQGNYLNLQSSKEIAFSHHVSAAINENSDLRLLSILNKEFHLLNRNQIQSILNNEMMYAVQTNTAASIIYNYPRQVVMAVIAFFGVVLSIMVYIIYNHQKHSKQVAELAYNDYMTGLHNYRWFEETAPMAIHKRMLNNTHLAVVLFGITNWTLMSEIHGQKPLAMELKEWGNKLCSKLWVAKLCVDSNHGRIIILAQGSTPSYILTNIQDLLKQPHKFTMEGIELRTNFKAGICPVKTPYTPIQQLISCADVAYHEIIDTKLQMKVFDVAMEDQLKLRQRIEDCMEQALKDEEYELWLQPKYEIKTHKCIGAEALVRWTSSKMGKLFPDQFIPVFEHTGFVVQLDFYMLRKTCQWLRKRLDAGENVVTISVNQSRLHMTEDRYLEKIDEVMNEYDIPHHLIELELTETAFDMDNPSQQKHALDIIHSLHDMGFKVSMDDFGSGYSSLMLLNFLPLDVMKLDKTMLNESQGSQRMTAILRNSIRMGHDLNMQIICEGIETQEQEELLLANGCHYGQGYFFSKPMPYKDFGPFLDAHS